TDHPTRNPYVQVSDDGRYLVQSTGIYYLRLGSDGAPAGELVRLIDTFDAEYAFIAAIEDVFYVRTTADAPNARLVAIDLAAPAREGWLDVIPESSFALRDTSIMSGHIVAQYLKDAHSLVRVTDLKGALRYEVDLPGLGSA